MTSERFEIVRPLAKGGFGEVWLGVDHVDGDRRVVIKRLHEGVDTAILAREYDVLRELAHPHIAQVIDFQADDDLNPRLVEDFVDGPDLAEACSGLSYVERGRLLAQVLRALDYVHARGVVHGDIKPSNVLVQRNGDTLSARVIDFGLAKRSDEATLSVSGTPAYMAPELIGGKAANAQCDLYAFGVMAYRIFTGQLPFVGMPLSELCQAHLEKLATLPTEVKADLPASLNPVLMRLLEKKPEDRYAGAGEVLSDLGEALGIRWHQETAETLKAYLVTGRLVGRREQLSRARRMWGRLKGNSRGIESREWDDHDFSGDSTITLNEDRLHLLWWCGSRASGRSRLIRNIADDARIDGGLVVQASGTEAGTLGAVKSWLRGLGVDVETINSAVDPLQAVDRAVDLLLCAVAETPVLLTLDDADRADELTLELLRVLCDRLAEYYIEGADCEPPRLGIVVASIEGPDSRFQDYAALCQSQFLEPLSSAGLEQWFSALLPQATSIPQEFSEGVMRLSHGLPGHVVALLGALVEQGRVSIQRGTLVIDSDALSAPLPNSLSDALAARESGLTENERAVLQVLRVLEHPVSQRVLSLLVDLDEPILSDVLRGLLGRALVGADEQLEPCYRAEGAGMALSEVELCTTHARIGRVLMGLGGRQSVQGLDIMAVAKHLYLAVHYGENDLLEAAHHSLKSAVNHASKYHNGADEAELLVWLIELAESSREAREYRLQRGSLFRRLGRFDDAMSAYEAVLNEKGVSVDDKDSAALGIAAIHIDRGEFEQSIELASNIAPTRQAYPASLARRAQALQLMGKNDDALAICEEGLALNPSPEVAADLGSTQALVFYYTGELDAALGVFEANAELYAVNQDLVGQATAVNGVGLIHHRRGDHRLALGAYEESLRLAERSGSRGRVASAAMNIGTVCHLTGRVALAAERYRESLRAADLIGDINGVAKASNNLGNLLIYLNRLPEARFWIDRSIREARRASHRLLSAHNRALLGMVLHKEGNFMAARRAISQAVADLREMGHSAEVGELQIELGMIARSERDTSAMLHFSDAVEQLVETSGTERQLAYVAFLRGESHRLMGDCTAGIEEFKRALQIVDRHGLYDLGWMCEAALARCYRENGKAMEAKARFHACTERIFAQAGMLSGRDREIFLKDPHRTTVLDEARLAMSDESAGISGEVVTGHDQLLRIMEINRRLATERDQQRLLDFILDSAIALTGAERGFVILTDSENSDGETHFEVSAARNIDRETLRRQGTKVSKSITRQVLESGEPVMTLDAGEDDRFKEALSVHHMKLRSILCFPLRTHGDVIGVIYMDNRFQRSTFADQDIQVLSAFADQAAVAITNAQLHEKNQANQEALKASNERVEKLNLELQNRVEDQAERLEEIEANLAIQRTQLQTRYSYDNIIGASPAMQRVFSVLDRVTDTGVPVLIQGESGTGKELVARAIHYNSSKRKKREFVSVNCAALSETLLESELFGHVRGAFTGADRDRKGLFETAHGGTMFLDEVADMSLPMQAKLLRTLQEGEVWPVGASKAIHVDCRIVAACNRDLNEMVNQGEFRQDLYFRLNVVSIMLPSLRDRDEDIIMLVQHFLRSFAEENDKAMVTLSGPVLDMLRNYSWPGNVRELEASVFNACLFCDGDTLMLDHFSHKPELVASVGVTAKAASQDAGFNLAGMSLAELEEQAIVAALERSEGNKVEAASQLGITRQTLYNKLKAYGIEVRRDVRRS